MARSYNEIKEDISRIKKELKERITTAIKTSNFSMYADDDGIIDGGLIKVKLDEYGQIWIYNLRDYPNSMNHIDQCRVDTLLAGYELILRELLVI